MADFHIKIVDVQGEQAWTAELWSGFPGSPGTNRIAGGASKYTLASLERDDDEIAGMKLDKASVLKSIRTQEQPDQIFVRAGVRLFELLEVTGVAAAWKHNQLADQRTFLEAPPSIAEWPWELLAEREDQNLYTRFFNDRLHPMMRVFRKPMPNLKWTDPTLRILLVSGEEVLDRANGFKASDELRRIREVFHKSEISALVQLCESPATLQDLEKSIHDTSPHIIHFIGHGDKNNQPGSEYFLQFKKDVTWEWATGQILQFFRNSVWKPRLVLLNACHASQYEKNAASVAAALLAAGVPAVIGSQAALRVDYARYFAEAFYRALAAEESLDRAMCVARAALTGMPQYQGLNRRHWALPILTVSAPPQEILRFKRANSQVKACRIIKEIYDRPGRFVGRATDRWSLISAFEPVDPKDPAYCGVILSGAPDLGKSWLVKRSVRDFLDAGYIVRYANLTGPQAGRTSIDVLLDWRGHPKEDSPVLGPIPGPHFAGFDSAYQQAKQNETAAAVQDVFTAFKNGMQSARAGGHKVLLILDRFRNKGGLAAVSNSDFREGLLSQLLLPLQKTDPADPDVEGVFALLVVRQYAGVAAGATSDEDEYGLSQLDKFERRELRGFEKGQLDNLFDEFSDFTPKPAADKLRGYLHDTISADLWSPKELEIIDRAVAGLLRT